MGYRVNAKSFVVESRYLHNTIKVESEMQAPSVPRSGEISTLCWDARRSLTVFKDE